jgi:class 3 adenylate cyclase
MEMAERLDPEAWSQIMQRFFRILCDSIERFEGFVDKFTGDGGMALFGAPIAHEDHAQRACYAALHLRDAARTYASEILAQHGMPFALRIGLNSGEVVVGRIGDDLRMEFTAQGHVVGLAQRMEAHAEPGHICLSERTARLVEGYFQLRDLGRITVKGVSEPVGLFDLEAVGSFRTRFDRSRARGLSAFVGRDREMAALDAALERARSGSGQVVGVVAEAGTGKSRLCAEFVESCRARAIPILEGRGVAHGKAIPMLPMLEMWRAFYEIGDGDGPETTRARIAGRLLLMDQSFREVLPFVFDLFGVPDPANPSPAIDPEQRQKRIHGVLKRILRDPAYAEPRVILLEDLHWFDGASDAYLETTVESVPATRDLLLVTFRPEYQASWMQRPYYQQVPLQPLDSEAIRALLRDQLGEDRASRRCPRSSVHALRATRSSSRRWCSRWWTAVSWRGRGGPTGWRRRSKRCRCRPAFKPSCRRSAAGARKAIAPDRRGDRQDVRRGAARPGHGERHGDRPDGARCAAIGAGGCGVPVRGGALSTT